MAFDEPNEAHADHFLHQDIDPEMIQVLGRASMILGQILRKGGHNVLAIPEHKRKNVIFKDGSVKTRAVLEGWYTEKNSQHWNRVSCLGKMFSEGSVERSGQTGVDDRKAIFGAIHTNMGSRYCIILFCGQEFTPITEPIHYRADQPGQNTFVKIDQSSPVSVACAANHRFHSDLQSVCELDDLHLPIGNAYFPAGPRILCMFVSVAMIRNYITTGYFRERCHRNTKGEFMKHMYEFSAGHRRRLPRMTSADARRIWTLSLSSTLSGPGSATSFTRPRGLHCTACSSRAATA